LGFLWVLIWVPSLCTFRFPLCVSIHPWWILNYSLCTFGYPLGVFSSFFVFIWVPLGCF
jgi:hypothetical protein